MKHFILRLSLFVLLLSIGAEVFFRVIIPAREAPIAVFQTQFGLETYDPSQQADGVFTSGRRAQQRSAWHINAQGWNQRTDFVADTKRQKPLAVMLGDSYVEGFYISPDAHVMQVLKRQLDHQVDVYQLGKSGSGLGHFIRMSKYLAAKQITPTVLTLLINRGDFLSSVARPNQKAMRDSQIVVKDDGSTELSPPKSKPAVTWRRWLRRSALARYLIWNANLNPFGGTADMAANRGRPSAAPNLRSDPRYAQAFSYMVAAIKTHLPTTKLVFLVDADREGFTMNQSPTPLPASAIISQVCARMGCQQVDLTAPFYTHWQTTGAPLNFDHDYHWNETAYRLAATALAKAIRPLLVTAP